MFAAIKLNELGQKKADETTKAFEALVKHLDSLKLDSSEFAKCLDKLLEANHLAMRAISLQYGNQE